VELAIHRPEGATAPSPAEMLRVPGPDSLDAAQPTGLLKGRPLPDHSKCVTPAHPGRTPSLTSGRTGPSQARLLARRGSADSGPPGRQGDTAVVPGPSPRVQRPEYAPPQTTRKGP
jgi:hypothetical protein